MANATEDEARKANILFRALCDSAREDPECKNKHLVGRIRGDTVEIVPCQTEPEAIALRDRLPLSERHETIQPLYTSYHLMPGVL
jgi:hypothetical protein